MFPLDGILPENLQQWNLVFSINRSQTSLNGSSQDEKSVSSNALRHVIFGVELFPKKAVNFRIGYNFRRAEELRVVDQRNFQAFLLVLGLKIN
jgi:hypothetical protein